MNLEGNICQKSSGASIQTQQIVSTSPDFNVLLKDIISEKEKSHSTKESSNGDGQSQERLKRVPFKIKQYSAYLFASTMLPLLNLLILFTQSYNLSWQNNFATIQRKNFQYYYIGISYYLTSIIIFLFATASTTLKLKDILRLYVLMDSNQVCVIASNICYGSLHLIYLCSNVTDSSYTIITVDVIYILLFILNNFAFMGHFRVSLVHFKWSIKYTLTFKILVFASSLSYFAYGILIIIGKDNLSILLNEANAIVQKFIQSTDFGNLTGQIQSQLLQQMSQLSSNISIIQNLINLFVFTSFANICEVLSRMNDFDKSSQLEPRYEIDDEEENEERINNIKNELDNKFSSLQEKVNSVMVIKQTMKLFAPKDTGQSQGIKSFIVGPNDRKQADLKLSI